MRATFTQQVRSNNAETIQLAFSSNRAGGCAGAASGRCIRDRAGWHTDAEEEYALGISLVEQGDYEQALEHFSQAISLAPDFADAYYQRAQANRALGNFEDAFADYNQAIELDPDVAIYYFQRAGFYYASREYALAVFDTSRAIEIDPEFASAYYARALLYMSVGNNSRAYDDLTTYIRLTEQEAYPEALTYLDELEKIGAEDDITAPGFFRDLGSAYYEIGNYEQAIIEYTYWVESRPSADSYSTRGGTYLMLGEYDRSLDDLNQALELDPEHSDTYNNRGLCYMMQEQYALAVQDFSRAIELSSYDDGMLYLNRGWAYNHAGEYEHAISDLEHAYDLGFHYPMLYRELGTAYYHLEDREQALTFLRQYVQLAEDAVEPEIMVILLELEAEAED